MKHQQRLSWFGGIIFVVLAFCVSACSNTSTTTTSNATSTTATNTTPTTSTGQNQSTSVASSTPGTSSPTSTYSQSTVLPTLPLRQMHMTDATHGWALDKNDVLKTSDGGKSWVALTPNGATISPASDADFLNASDAWFSTPNIDGTITIFSTTTGGASWKSSSIHEPGPNGGSLTFVSNQTGWFEVPSDIIRAGSEPVDIFRTDDGGVTWSKISSSGQGNLLPGGGLKTGLSFVNTETGWATGDLASNIPWLYVTHDGGRTWHQQSIAGTNDVNVSYATYPPLILGNNVYLPMLVTPATPHSATSHTVLARSTDGGVNWTINGQQLTPSMGNDVYVMDTQTVWGADASTGDVYQTTNGGQTWQKIANNTGIEGPLSFINTTTGFGLGPVNQTVLKRTDDGGQTWQTISYQIHSA